MMRKPIDSMCKHDNACEKQHSPKWSTVTAHLVGVADDDAAHAGAAQLLRGVEVRLRVRAAAAHVVPRDHTLEGVLQPRGLQRRPHAGLRRW